MGKAGPYHLHLAEGAALLAGRYLQDAGSVWRQVDHHAPHDLKIQADRKAEELILEALAPSGLPTFSEEAGGAANPGQGAAWIVDPLDGSVNFQRGLPLCCVSIALYDAWRPLLGVVYDFNRGELFSGLVGKGATLNGQSIQPSSTQQVSQAVLATGFPAARDYSDDSLLRFLRRVQDFRKLRLLGSAALSLCYVACGRVDAYLEESIRFWDVAAGAAVVASAGGTVQFVPQEDWNQPIRTMASNGCLESYI